MPLDLAEYLKLLDWTSRQITLGKASVSADQPAVLARLGISAQSWLPLATRFGRLFQRVAGAPPSIARLKQGSRISFRCREAQLLAAG